MLKVVTTLRRRLPKTAAQGEEALEPEVGDLHYTKFTLSAVYNQAMTFLVEGRRQLTA